MSKGETGGQSGVSKPHSELVLPFFDDYPPAAKTTLFAVRQLIYYFRKSDSEIGQLKEALHWGELGFLTEKPNTGSIIRLALNGFVKPALFFHCGTTLIESFRAQYSHIFEFEKNRTMVLRLPVDDTAAELRHCIQQALRYKLDKRS